MDHYPGRKSGKSMSSPQNLPPEVIPLVGLMVEPALSVPSPVNLVGRIKRPAKAEGISGEFYSSQLKYINL